jgi:hypothetical protein
MKMSNFRNTEVLSHFCELVLHVMYGDRKDYNLYRNQSIHAANQVLVGQGSLTVRL